MSDDVERLLAEQIRYYDDRAPGYEDLWFRHGRYDRGATFNERWFAETAIVEAAVDAFDWSGTVLELACGSGLWTRRLARGLAGWWPSTPPRRCSSGTAPGSADRTSRTCRRISSPWEPAGRFDAIFTGFFVSHVPPERFASFWGRVASWLTPGGMVFLVDDAAGPDRPYSGDMVRGGPAFAHRRELPGDREYTIVKVFYSPGSLKEALDAVGWDADLHPSGEHFLSGTAQPR